MSDFQKNFEAFASFGSAPTKEMDNNHFAKMLKECKIIGKSFTSTDADLLFSKIKAKGARKITFEEFTAKAVPEIAAKMKKTDADIEALIAQHSPEARGTKADAVKFHDDKSLYTGVAKEGGPTNVDRNSGSLAGVVDRRVSQTDVRGTTAKQGSPAERESVSSHDRLAEDPHGLGSPGAYDDDGDVSNVAVGAASPTWEAQSPVDVGPRPTDGATASNLLFAARFHGSPSTIDERNGSTTSDLAVTSAVPLVTAQRGISSGQMGGSEGEDGERSSTAASAGVPSAFAGTNASSAVATAAGLTAPTYTTSTPPNMNPGAVLAAHPVAHTLTLNMHNLATFEDSVQRGTVPLRTDMIDGRRFLPQMVDGSGHNSGARSGVHVDPERSASVLTNYPPRSVGNGSVSTLNNNLSIDNNTIIGLRNRFGSTDALAPTPLAMQSRSIEEATATGSTRGADSQVANEALSVITMDSATAQPRVGTGVGGFHRAADPLSQENLQLHLRELTSGAPMPLTIENIGPDLPVRPLSNSAGEDSDPAVRDEPGTSRVRADLSVLVEASEASRSEVACTVDASVLRATIMTAVQSDGNMEEMWSTVSAHDVDARSQASTTWTTGDALQSLSKKNLRQLRRQLESGETPLRPEVLAGLSNVAKAMNMQSETSASMIVEVPVDEVGGDRHDVMRARLAKPHADSTAADTGDEVDPVSSRLPMGSCRIHRDPTGSQDAEEQEDGDLDADMDYEDNGSHNGSLRYKSSLMVHADTAAASDAGGTSFHSTMVEAPSRRSGGGGRARGATMAAVEATVTNSMRTRGERPPTSVGRSRGPVCGMAGVAGAGGVTGGGAGVVAGGDDAVGAGRAGGGPQHRDVGFTLADATHNSANGRGRHHQRGRRRSTNPDDTLDEDEDDDGDLDDDRLGEEDDKSSTALSPDDDDDDVNDEGHNDESVFMTEEDGPEGHARVDIVYLKRCVREVARSVKATRRDQLLLSRQLQGIRDELSPAHASSSRQALDTLSADVDDSDREMQKIIASLRAEMAEMRLYILEMRRSQAMLVGKVDQLCANSNSGAAAGVRSASSREGSSSPGGTRAPLSPLAGHLVQSPRVRVIVKFDMALLSGTTRTGPSTVVSFLVPMPPDATVRDCKEEFLRRLREQNPTAAAALPMDSTFLEMEGHALFDSLLLGADLHFDSKQPEGYSVTVRKAPL